MADKHRKNKDHVCAVNDQGDQELSPQQLNDSANPGIRSNVCFHLSAWKQKVLAQDTTLIENRFCSFLVTKTFRPLARGLQQVLGLIFC